MFIWRCTFQFQTTHVGWHMSTPMKLLELRILKIVSKILTKYMYNILP